MNGRKAKYLRAKAYSLAAEWLKTMLPESEQGAVTPQSVRAFEADQEKYILSGPCIRVSAYSSRWFYKRLKKAFKRDSNPDFTLNSVLELG